MSKAILAVLSIGLFGCLSGRPALICHPGVHSTPLYAQHGKIIMTSFPHCMRDR